MTKRKYCFSMLVCLLMLLGGCAPASPQEAAAESTVEISDVQTFCGQQLEEHMNACGYRDYQVTASSVVFRPAAERYFCRYQLNVTDSGGTAEEMSYCYEIRAEDGVCFVAQEGAEIGESVLLEE